MGDIPASNNMISAVFTNPRSGENPKVGDDITFSVKINNLEAGTFTNPNNTYYAAPQSLQSGQGIGHTHVSVQDLNNQQNPANPPNAQTFAFFKGINDASDGQGTLSADLPRGLPAGQYRVCSITSAANHQPVVMPIAQRDPQDDCVRFQVTENGAAGGGQNNRQNGGNNAGNNSQGGQGKGGQGQDQGQQCQSQSQGQRQQRGRGRGRFNRPRFAARDLIA